MDAGQLAPAVVAGVLGVLLVVVLLRRQRSQYAGHVGQLAPKGGAEESAQQRRASKARKPLGTFSREEVARHCTRDDAWIIVHDKATGLDKVYDVTEYVDEHPGGESILSHAGGDATEGFLGPQHPATVFVLVEDFLIGTLSQ